MSSNALPGFRDFYPAELAVRAHIMNTWRRVAGQHAFVEYDGPPLEPLDLYTAKSGDEIVGQLYAFEDKGGRAVAMRPEMTPTFARMVAAKAQTLRKPVRWFSIPQLFRYERQQKGRLREHFQLNVDIVGEADVLADAELLAVAIGMCRAFGLDRTDFFARVSDRRLLNALLVHLRVNPEQWAAVYAVLDKLERQPRDVSDGKLRDAGIADDTRAHILALQQADTVAALRTQYGHDADVTVHLDRLDEYTTHLNALGVGDFMRLDLTIVRGLAYYTGIVFELFDAQGEFRAICGGGRYDDLLNAIGGVSLPALGFGMGDVVLGELLAARGKLAAAQPAAPDVVLVAGDGVSVAQLLGTATALRARGMCVEYPLSADKLVARKASAQLKDAQKTGAAVAVVQHADGTHDVVALNERAPEISARLSPVI